MKIENITYQDGVCRIEGKMSLFEKLSLMLSSRVVAEVKVDSTDEELTVDCELEGSRKLRLPRRTPDKVKTHKEICKELNDTYAAKNADYGDSFAKLREEFPDAILIRLTDKLNRLKTLYHIGRKRRVRDESIEDTLLDLANYCIMEVGERRAEAAKNQKGQNHV